MKLTLYRGRRRRAAAGVGLAAVLLAGCAHYRPLPLATTPPLAPNLAQERGGFPVGQPLNVGEVVRLTLENNPDLRAGRARRGVAGAQLLQARILPNPTFSGAFLPLLSGVGTSPAFSIGITQNIRALITYRTRRREAEFVQAQVYADVLWQEWQVAGLARQLAVELMVEARARTSYAQAYDLLARRNAVLQRALAAGNATLVTAAPSLVGFQAARTNLQALDQRQLARRHRLNALMGLVPDAVVPLAGTPDLPPFDAAQIRASLATMPDRRPDLLALRLGYQAQDQLIRQQILSQFPDMVLGGGVNRDNAHVVNAGPQISIGVPIFDRNQGNIAFAQATRARLNAEYAARLATTAGEVGAFLTEMAQVSEQIAIVRRDLPAARLAAERAAAAFGTSNLDERSYVELVTNRYTKEEQIMALELALYDRQIALQTLTGAGLPSVETLPPVRAAKVARR